MEIALDSISLYMAECSNHNLLTSSREAYLIRRFKAGDRHACDELVRSNQRLVISIANNYVSMAGDQDISDLIQWGNLGLIEAIKKFDPSRGFRLSTYAYPWIRAYVRRGAMSKGNRVSISYGDQEIRVRVGRSITELYQLLGRDPSPEEIADHMGINVEKISPVLSLLSSVISLDHESSSDDDESQSLANIVPDGSPSVESLVEDAANLELLARVLAAMPQVYRDVLRLRYGLESGEQMSLEDIGGVLHLSRERVRQIEIHAINRMKLALIIGRPID